MYVLVLVEDFQGGFDIELSLIFYFIFISNDIYIMTKMYFSPVFFSLMKAL